MEIIREHINKREGKMKKICFIVVAYITILLLSACGEKSVQDESGIGNIEEQNLFIGQENKIYSSAIAEEKEFYEIILNNPVDKTFIWDGDVGSEARIKKAVEYRDLWNTEIKHTLAILKENLTQEDYTMLETAYANWREYMDATMSVEQNIFYVGTDYGVGCNDTYPLVMEAYAERTKEYAVELMALEYALTGKVEFSVWCELVESTSGVPDQYEGAYNSYDVNEPDLQIQKNEDGTYLIQIGIHRLTFLRECTGILAEDKIVFSTTEWGEDKEITGTIAVDDEDIATVTLEAAWSDWWFKNINVYKYYKVSDTPDIYELQY